MISPNATSGVESADIPIPNNPDGIAFIQYTSGSTGNPKGVMITHHNLLTNIQQMVIGMEITLQEIFISWLPVYHDMGLILKTMVPFYLGAVVHLLETNLKDVGTWLQAIQDNKGTFTAAPDFAYRLCLRQIDPEQYDLSSLRVALNAAEPVRYSTIRDFEEAFRIPNTMVAGYGLAEATVGVSMWKPGAAALVDSNGHVSVGKPFPGVDILIVDGGKVLDFGQIGEIAIRSQANSLGYYQNPEQTGLLHWRDQYYLSGDLGYLDQERNLFIVSRKKNIIKRAGETISPQEIEEIVDRFPDIRYSAAVGIDSGGIEGEQVYIFAEVRIEDPSDQDVF
ncbi:MAG: AMP-binding protein, partial [Anaerolineales bacterium]